MTLNPQPFWAAAGARPLTAAPGAEPSPDGWLGTNDEPGYRAGQVVVKLADLPVVDEQHLYLDLLLLDGDGRIEDSHSGPCAAMDRRQPREQRARFVRIVAELLRHVPDRERGLVGLGPALTHLREHGIDGGQLAAAAQQLDAACSDEALTTTLVHMLALSLGEDEARAVLREVLAKLQRSAPRGEPDWPAPHADLHEQVGCVVRRFGRARARRYLREATDFELLPSSELLGIV